MAASAAARRHTRQVETAIDARIALDDAEKLDAREGEARDRARRYVRGLANALRQEEHFDELADTERRRARELVTELCGILDRGEVQQRPLFPVVDVSRAKDRAS